MTSLNTSKKNKMKNFCIDLDSHDFSNSLNPIKEYYRHIAEVDIYNEIDDNLFKWRFAFLMGSVVGLFYMTTGFDNFLRLFYETGSLIFIGLSTAFLASMMIFLFWLGYKLFGEEKIEKLSNSKKNLKRVDDLVNEYVPPFESNDIISAHSSFEQLEKKYKIVKFNEEVFTFLLQDVKSGDFKEEKIRSLFENYKKTVV